MRFAAATACLPLLALPPICAAERLSCWMNNSHQKPEAVCVKNVVMDWLAKIAWQRCGTDASAALTPTGLVSGVARGCNEVVSSVCGPDGEVAWCPSDCLEERRTRST